MAGFFRCGVLGAVCLLVGVAALHAKDDEDGAKPKSKKAPPKFDGHSAILEKAFREILLKKLKSPDPKLPALAPAKTSEDDLKATVIDPTVSSLNEDKFFNATEEDETKFKSGHFKDDANVRRMRFGMARLVDLGAKASDLTQVFMGVGLDKLKNVDLELCARLIERDVRRVEASKQP